MFLTECPRDAMQGWGEFIPTQKKIDYINALMEVGFDVLIVEVSCRQKPFLKWQILKT